MKIIYLILIITLTLQAKELPKGFGYIKDIELDIRYYSSNNFIGQPIDGYLAPKAVLSNQALKALIKVQNSLKPFGLGLKVFDAYRPQKAVDHFVKWGLDLNDTLMQNEYYPTVEKKNLFKEGYIAKKSGHSRGSTVDLTIIDLETKQELDMGSPFDFFGKKSWIFYENITTQQRANRMLLHTIMVKYKFKSYAQEWWHFTLKNEPYKKYFDFNIE
jgi:D-alanyl-D-alanine dipeptidase